MARVVSLYRYPVKGFSPEALDSVTLAAERGFPMDRAWAVAHGTTAFDPAAPAYLPKQKFAMLMRNEALAKLRTRYFDDRGEFRIALPGQSSRSYRLDTDDGRAGLAAFVDGWLAGEMEGGAKTVSAPGHMFSDVAAPFVSLINLASCTALSEQAGAFVDPLRFRANIYFDGLPAWQELDWVGRTLKVSAVEMRVTKRTRRCAATNVNPSTAERDMALPALLQQTYGHADNGIYAMVTKGGVLTPGDVVVVG
jgi:uncharacterized protein YcbX